MDTGIIETVPLTSLIEIQRAILASKETDFYTRMAKWFFADGSSRTISPWSKVTVSDYLKRRIDEDSVESLREALVLSRGNSDAKKRLAELLQKEKE